MTSTERPLLLGHRGARLRYLPENTLAVFELALEAGCDGFEFDVRSCLDDELVICHDPSLHGLQIARTTYRELRERRADRMCRRLGSRLRPAREQQQGALCCLREVLQRYAGRAFLDLEMKVAGFEDALLAALRRTSPRRGYVVSSFLPQALHTIREKDDQVPLGFICDRTRELALWPTLPVSYVIPQYKLATERLVDTLHAADKKVIVWTVNRESDMRRLAGWGVDGIVSDNPALLARTLG